MSGNAYALIDPSAPMVSGWRSPLPNRTSGLYVPASRLLRAAERVTPDKRLAPKLMTTSAISSLWRRRKAAAPPVALTGVKSPLPSAGRVVCAMAGSPHPGAGLERSAGPSNGCRRRRMRRGAIWLRAAGAVDAAGGRPRASLGDGSRSGAQPSGCLLRVVCNRLAKAFPVCRSRIADYVFKDHTPSAIQGKARLRGLFQTKRHPC